MIQQQKKFFLIFIILILSLPIIDYSDQNLFNFVIVNITEAFYITLFIFAVSVYYASNKKVYFALAGSCISAYAIILFFEHRERAILGFLLAAALQLIIWPFFFFSTYRHHSSDLRLLSIIGFGFHIFSLGSYLISKEFYNLYGLYFDLYYFVTLTYVLYVANWSRLIERLQSELIQATEINEKREMELEHQLQIARQIQARTLPNGNEIKNVDIAFKYEPLWQLGGDFCSIILPGTTFFHKRAREITDLSHCGLLVGDVVGKGPAAALIMSDIIASTQMMGFGRIKPSETLETLNERLCEKEGTNLPYLATACYLAIDVDLQEIIFANAGHEPPLMYHLKTEEVVPVKTRGVMLGVDIDVTKYEEKALRYEIGDKLVLYTDGLLDMMPSEFNLPELVKKYGKLPAQDMLDSIIPYVTNQNNAKVHYDDYLILILDFKGEEQ